MHEYETFNSFLFENFIVRVRWAKVSANNFQELFTDFCLLTHIYIYFSAFNEIKTVTIFFIQQGGIKAVVWVDTIQSVIMVAGIFAVSIKTSMIIGGVKAAFAAVREAGLGNFWKFVFLVEKHLL